MQGNLYVAAKYWAYGYSDGMHHAGGVGKQRKRYSIDGRTYWADASELPGLIAALVSRPAKQEKVVAKAVKRPAKAAQKKVATQVAPAPVVAVEARLDALAEQFRRFDDEVLMQSLEIARQRLRDMDEEDIEMLVLV